MCECRALSLVPFGRKELDSPRYLRWMNDPQITSAGLYHANEVMTAYLRPEKNLLYEYVTLDNQLVDTPQGRAIPAALLLEV